MKLFYKLALRQGACIEVWSMHLASTFDDVEG